MYEWREKAYNLSMQGLNATQVFEELSKEYDVDKEAVRQVIKQERKKKGTNRTCTGQPQNTESHKVKIDGDTKVFDDINECVTGEEITPEWIMREKGLNPKEWEVISFTKNVWQQQTKDGDKINLCQSKLTVRPIKRDGLTFEDIDEWFKTKSFNKFTKVKPIEYNNSNEVLEIDIADLHIGLLAWRYETNNDWDLHICQEKFLQGIRDTVDRAKGRKFKAIYLCTLGDVIHIDNMQGATTKGTVQQTDGRATKIFDFAYDTMAQAINMLSELHSPIKYIYLCGNHDTLTGYCLAKMLKATIPDVDFDVEPKPQKAIHFGRCLIGLTHGDMPKNNQGLWLMNDYRREFGASDFIEIHAGHFHSESTKTVNGILTKYVLAQCGNSYWENQQGYRSQRGIQCFVWNEETGLRESWYYIY